MNAPEGFRGWPRQPAKWMFLPPFALGALILVLAATLGPGAERDDSPASPLPVRALTVEAVPVVPVLTGYGEARPIRVWQGIAQVSGRLEWLHPDLRAGAAFDAGTRIAVIDRTDYALAVRRAEAARAVARARRDELDARARDLTDSIEIEARALAIAEREFERRRSLVAGGHISRIEADAEEQRLLRQRQNLQSLRSQANLVPAQRTALEAQVAEAEAQLAKARADLERTELTMPFDGRIDQLQAEATQFVAAGQPLFAASSTEAVEVVLRVAPEQLWSRFPALAGPSAAAAAADLDARVTFEAGDARLGWPGRVTRVDPSIDPQSRTAQLYVRVDNAADGATSGGANVPLGGHLFVAVHLTGPALPGRIVIPRHAYYDGFVYVVDEGYVDEGYVRRRAVDVAFRQGDVVVLSGGLVPGDTIVVSDLLFPVDGMPVTVIEGYDDAIAADRMP
jgi:membrane fusion protein, multidrug efflux system